MAQKRRKDSAKRTVGRPFQEKPVAGLTPESLADFSRKRFSLAGVAAEYGISKSTLMRRLEAKPALAEAWYTEEGRKHDRLRAAIWKSALGDLEYWKLVGADPTDAEKKAARPPQPVSQIWLSKNELGWTDKNLVEGKYGGDTKKIPDDELAKLAAEALVKLGKPVPAEVRENVARGRAREDEDDAA